MNRHHVTLFLQRGEALAAAVPATDPQRLAWVGVYPLDLASPLALKALQNKGVIVPATSERPVCRIRYFEVERSLVEADISLAEEDLHSKSDYYVFGIDDLSVVLARLGVDLEQLERPFKSDYPI